MSFLTNLMAKIELGQCTYDKSKKGTQPTFYTSVISALTLALSCLLFLTLVLLFLFLVGTILGPLGVGLCIVFAIIFGFSLAMMRID